MKENDLYWLAGWLEGEGSFMKGAPSSPNLPIISAITTDEDIIKKVSNIFGVKYFKTSEIRKKKHWKTCYAIRIRGKKAVDLMIILKPLMGIRRKQQIEKALSCYEVRSYKLTEEIVKNIKIDLKDGFFQSHVAKKYKIRRETVNRINTKKRWSHVKI